MKILLMQFSSASCWYKLLTVDNVLGEGTVSDAAL
jgi:hypothetical protein